MVKSEAYPTLEKGADEGTGSDKHQHIRASPIPVSYRIKRTRRVKPKRKTRITYIEPKLATVRVLKELG